MEFLNRNELIFINEEYFFEKFGLSADDFYLFHGKSYFVDYHENVDCVTITNPRLIHKFNYDGRPFEIRKELVDKLFCTKIQYRKYKLKKLNDISEILYT